MNPIFSSNGSPEQTYARQQLAAAITAKGVPTDPKSSFNVMAEKVGLIQQEIYELQGDKIYEQQMFGAETISPEPYKQNGPLWNLYKVMTDLLSDARFIGYGGILLAEYYKGYDTIELMNAGAGGAYFTCDGDFYTTDKAGENAHVWHDDDNGMANRWVAYLFAAPESNYTIPSTELCPRSIHIGRSVGALICNFTSRFDSVVVTDGNSLSEIRFGNGINTFNNNNTVVIRNIKKHSVGSYVNSIYSTMRNLIVDVEEILNKYIAEFNQSNNVNTTVEYIYCGVKHISGGAVLSINYNSRDTYAIRELHCPNLEIVSGGDIIQNANGSNFICPLRLIDLQNLKQLSSELLPHNYTMLGTETWHLLEDIKVGSMETNLKCRYWNPVDILSTPEGIATINANIRDHIAAKVSDRTGLTALTFTVSTNLYNNLEQATLDAFTAKNWNVAGA